MVEGNHRPSASKVSWALTGAALVGLVVCAFELRSLNRRLETLELQVQRHKTVRPSSSEPGMPSGTMTDPPIVRPRKSDSEESPEGPSTSSGAKDPATEEMTVRLVNRIMDEREAKAKNDRAHRLVEIRVKWLCENLQILESQRGFFSMEAEKLLTKVEDLKAMSPDPSKGVDPSYLKQLESLKQSFSLATFALLNEDQKSKLKDYLDKYVR
jgi:hypothetical protein